MKKKILHFFMMGATALFTMASINANTPTTPAEVTLTGDWSFRVTYAEQNADFTMDGPDYITHIDEKYDSLPLFNPTGPAWHKALPLKGTAASECCVFDALVPGSTQVRLNPGDAPLLIPNTDYLLDERSGNIGRLADGAIGENVPVYITYVSLEMRIDSVVLTQNGTLTLRRGTPHQATPVPPTLAEGEKRLVNLWIDGRISRLNENLVYPILSDAEVISFCDDAPNPNPVVASLCPQTYKKLVNGETVRILAWGDSVTACGFLPDADRWQVQFTTRLAKKFPTAKIVLLTEAWGGRSSLDYLSEPAGSQKNYQEKVLNLKPDLVISEFVNDAGLNQNGVDQQYGRIRDVFREIGAEWIIIAPHYVRPDWMGLDRQKNIDDDPRPYVAALRRFSAENKIALADGSLLYGQLWRKGIPYNTLMVNNINHPNRIGMSLFADALMKLF